MNTLVVTSPTVAGEAAADPALTGQAAVEIAEIQAGRDVEIAEIQADTTALALETQQEEDETWLRDELAGLRGSHAALAESLSGVAQSLESLAEQQAETARQLTELLASSIPQPPLEPPPETIPAEPALQPDADGEDLPAPKRVQRQLRWL